MANGVRNLLQAVLLYRFVGLRSFYRTFLAPLAGGVFVDGPMAGVHQLLGTGSGPGPSSAIIGYGVALRLGDPG